MSARKLAVRCLLEVDRGAYSNLTFKKNTSDTVLDRRDIQFAAALFYGTLERQTTLDYILGKYLKGGVAKLDPEIRAIMRSGLYQCIFMDSVPVSAAVNESAKLCKVMKKTSAASLVNAVLRKAAVFDMSDFDRIRDDVKRLSLKYSLCGGLVQLLCSQYGDTAEEIMGAMLERPKTAVRVNSLKTTVSELVSELASEGVETEISSDIKNALIIKSGNYLKSSALRDGRMRVQSLAAQCSALALDAKSGMTVLDMCAAPGGKTLTAAQEMNNEGKITALDCYESRLTLIEKQAKAEGITIVEPILGDASAYSAGQFFDRVLCDVPCSGYGEISSKPELRTKAPQNDNQLFSLQSSILQNGAAQLKVKGKLIYSTCTLDFRENEDIVGKFLSSNSNFCLNIPTFAENIPVSADKCIKFIPENDNSEGFFIATFERMC
ncbi:MAG: 16S rRNA (cytosine(967)-C(5))-methyltransferase RsmB [Oscillospiraceae bacterium]